MPASQDRCYFVYGLLGLLDDQRFVRFDGIAWELDEAALYEHLAAIANAGANAVRFFAWSVWAPRPFGRRSQFQAFVLKPDESAWVLSEYNSYYRPILERVVEIANGCGLTVFFDWLNQCEIQSGAWRQFSPWANNAEGGYDFYDPKIRAQVKKFMTDCVDWLAGRDVVWGFNEADWWDFRSFSRDVYLPVIMEKGLDPMRCRNGAGAKMPDFDPATNKYTWSIDVQHWVRYDAEPVIGEFAVSRWLREIHGAKNLDRPGIVDAFFEGWGPFAVRKDLSDDGVFDGDSTEDFVIYGGVYQRRPSATTWAKIVAAALRYSIEHWWLGARMEKLWTFEHCPKAADVAIHVRVFELMSEEYKKRFGVYPSNWRAIDMSNFVTKDELAAAIGQVVDLIIEVQRGNTQHYPGEAFDAPVRPDWENRVRTCGMSHREAGPDCYIVIWWWLKQNDPVVQCNMCTRIRRGLLLTP